MLTIVLWVFLFPTECIPTLHPCMNGNAPPAPGPAGVPIPRVLSLLENSRLCNTSVWISDPISSKRTSQGNSALNQSFFCRVVTMYLRQ